MIQLQQPVVCSATNRQKKVFNFGEVEEIHNNSISKQAKL
jgi:hypothetical protein